MRISFVLPFWRPYLGGVETAAFELAKALSQEHEVQVHTSAVGPQGTRLPVGRTYDGEASCWVTRYRSPRGMIVFRPAHLNADVVHYHGFHRFLIAAALTSSSTVPVVLQPHGNLSTVAGEPRGLRRTARVLLDRTWSPLLLRRFSRVLCLKEEERVIMVNAGVAPDRCRIVRAPIHPTDHGGPHWSPAAARDPGLFICVGRVTPLKYVEHAVRAIAATAGLRLVVLGPVADRGYLASLQALVTNFGLERQVSFVGPVPDLSRWYAQASGVILCSKAEGQGLVMAEAVSHGAIPIGTSEAVGELAAHMGGVMTYEWGDIPQLASALARVAAARTQGKDLLGDGPEWVRANLAPDVIAQQVLAVYREVIAEWRHV